MTAKALAECGILICGGSSGVGLEAARQFIAAGAPRVVLLARNADRLNTAVASVAVAQGGVTVSGIRADASDVESATAGIAEAINRLGQVDVLINSTAGSFPPALLADIAPADVEPTLRGQMLAPILVTTIVLPHMAQRGGGAIINIASDAAKVATPGETVLGAAMAGIVMFSRTAAMEAKRFGVRVNVITPSLISGTPTTELVSGEGFGKKLFARAAAQAHLGVPGPADVAALAVFLAGPGAAKLTGQAISVNGGISAA